MEGLPRILTAMPKGVKEWEINTKNINELHSFFKDNNSPKVIKDIFNRLHRYLIKSHVFIGIKLFVNRKQYDIIISNHVIQAMTYSFLSFFSRNNQGLHILDELYLLEPVKLKQKIKIMIFKLLLRPVDHIRVNSTNEISNYSRVLKIGIEKFWFLPFPAPPVRKAEANEGYILSAGKQYRDYSTLVKAVEGTGYKLIIVSDRDSMRNVSINPGITVFYNIKREKYFDLLKKSKIVVTPLSNDFCSCGQVAFLEAMSYGKPVIVAKVTGSIDYIEDGKSGLFYEKYNYLDLREKIILLNENEELRNKISYGATNAVENYLNAEIFVKRYLQFMNKIWEKYRNS